MIEFKKYVIYGGNYGSGKTELSLNTALKMAKSGKKTVLVDMDIVNPYFRSSEKTELLNEAGIKVVAPCFANTTVDVPSLPPDMFMPFDDTTVESAVFDCGGDPVGAAALGQLAPRFEAAPEDFEFIYVINTMRPLQETADSILEMMRQIEAVSKLRVTAIACNGNIANATDAGLVESSIAVTAEAAEKAGVPIKFTAVKEDIADEVGSFAGDKYPIRLYMRPGWLDEDE